MTLFRVGDGVGKGINQGHFSTRQISGLSSFTENLAHSATFDKLAEHVNNFFLKYMKTTRFVLSKSPLRDSISSPVRHATK